MPIPFTRKLPDRSIESLTEPGLTLVALAATDLPMIGRWLAEPHVARWWSPVEQSAEHIAGHLTDDFVAPFVMRERGRPIGYLQVYHANDSAFWAAHELPRETFGLDLFIGETACRGRGLGPRFMRMAMQRLFEMPNVRRIHIDPNPANQAAITANEKAGFRRRGLIDTPNGPSLYMMTER